MQATVQELVSQGSVSDTGSPELLSELISVIAEEFVLSISR